MKAVRVKNLNLANEVAQAARKINFDVVAHRVTAKSRRLLPVKWDPALEGKPLFIPLKTEWFLKFESGTKTTEYRAYGPRWNEKTCQYGRPATLSHGYNGRRLKRYVVGFAKIPRRLAPAVAREIFPKARSIAAIKLAEKKPAMIFTLRRPRYAVRSKASNGGR